MDVYAIYQSYLQKTGKQEVASDLTLAEVLSAIAVTLDLKLQTPDKHIISGLEMPVIAVDAGDGDDEPDDDKSKSHRKKESSHHPPGKKGSH